MVDALVDLASAKSGDKLDLQLARGGGAAVQRLNVSVMVTKAPPPPPNQMLLTKLGVEGVTVTPAVVKKYHLPVSRGVLLTAIKPDSAADAAGLQAGDVLSQLGRYPVNSVEDVEALLKTAPSDLDVQIGIVRNDERGRGLIHLR
jgi:membrane-associated protease RseP (regulator of RpoE activity)